ncbi:MAG: sulfotransferase domain-containing protein [Lentisphaerae bacterium]|nr:sulfotransferase domain-containing protein [Lentisphaerota bacterium]
MTTPVAKDLRAGEARETLSSAIDAIDKLIGVNRYEESAEQIGLLLEQSHRYPILTLRLAAQWSEIGQHEKALTIYSQLLTQSNAIPVQWRCHIQIGELQRRWGKHMATAHHYVAATRLRPDHQRPCQSLTQLRHFPDVRTFCIEQLEEIRASDTEFHPLLHITLGDLYMAAGHLELALASWRLGSWSSARRNDPQRFGDTPVTAERARPDFMILGAMKSGTTSLFKYIAEHPCIFPTVKKEIHYFDCAPLLVRGSYDIDEYLSFYPPERPGRDVLIGEGTPNNYCLPIQDFVIRELPKTRFLLVLRDPSKRAISHYFHFRRAGVETRPIEEALFEGCEHAQELLALPPYEAGLRAMQWYAAIKCGDTSTLNVYLLMGLYDCFLSVWFQAIARERFCLVTHAELAADPQTAVQRAHRFLGLAPDGLSAQKVWVKGIYNRSKRYGVEERLEEFFAPFMHRLRESTGIEVPASVS